MLICKRLRHTSTLSGILKTRHNHTTTFDPTTSPYTIDSLSTTTDYSAPPPSNTPVTTPYNFHTPTSQTDDLRLTSHLLRTTSSATTTRAASAHPCVHSTGREILAHPCVHTTGREILLAETHMRVQAGRDHALSSYGPRGVRFISEGRPEVANSREKKKRLLLNVWEQRTPNSLLPPPPALPLQGVPSVRNCNNWIKAFAELSMWDQMTEVHQYLKETNLQPSSITFALLCTWYSKAGQPEQVVKLVEEMDAMKYERDQLVLSALLFLKELDPALLKKLWTELRQLSTFSVDDNRELQKIRRLFSRLAWRFRVSRMPDQIKELWNFIQTHKIELDYPLANAMNHSFTLFRLHSARRQMYTEVRRAGVAKFPLQLFVHLELPSTELRTVWSELKAAGNLETTGLTSVDTHYLLKSVPYTDIQQVRDIMTTNGIPLNKWHISALVGRFLAAMDEDKLCDFVEEVQGGNDTQLPADPTFLICNFYATASPTDVKSALPLLRSLWTDMQNGNLELTSVKDTMRVWQSLVAALGKHEGWDEVQEMAEWILGENKEKLVETDEIQNQVLRVLMQVFGSGGKADETAHLFNHLLTGLLESRASSDTGSQEQLMLGSDAYWLLYAHAKAGQIDMLKQLWQYCEVQCNLTSETDIFCLVNLFATNNLCNELKGMLTLLATRHQRSGERSAEVDAWLKDVNAFSAATDQEESVSAACEKWASDPELAKTSALFWAKCTAKYLPA